MRLPPYLKTVEDDTFRECRSLKTLELPEGLEEIYFQAFAQSGVERIEFPASLRVLAQATFYQYMSLKAVKFREGLEVLGTDEHFNKGYAYFGVFQESAVEDVELPSTLRRIECWAFMDCKNLQSIRLPDSLECVERWGFFKSGLQTIQVPAAGVRAKEDDFDYCPAINSIVFRDGRVFQKGCE